MSIARRRAVLSCVGIMLVASEVMPWVATTCNRCIRESCPGTRTAVPVSLYMLSRTSRDDERGLGVSSAMGELGRVVTDRRMTVPARSVRRIAASTEPASSATDPSATCVDAIHTQPVEGIEASIRSGW